MKYETKPLPPNPDTHTRTFRIVGMKGMRFDCSETDDGKPVIYVTVPTSDKPAFSNDFTDELENVLGMIAPYAEEQLGKLLDRKLISDLVI